MVHPAEDVLIIAKNLKVNYVVINGKLNYIPEY
jgi:hypothetical protein